MPQPADRHGSVLILALVVSAVLIALFNVFAMRALNESRLERLQRQKVEAFYLAEAGIQKALWVISQNPSLDDAYLEAQVNADNLLGAGQFQIEIDSDGDPSTKTILSTGTAASTSRRVRVQARNSWVNKIPSAVYSPAPIKVTFDKRTEAADDYIDGHTGPGLYSTASVNTTLEGEGRITGSPAILENQPVPEGLQDGLWDAFDLTALRDTAKANGTYFSADATADEFNNPYNKEGKYTLPVEPGQTHGVFFFDAENGESLNPEQINSGNEVRVKLEGTTEQMSGIIVVVGDLDIKDTNQYDFLFDGVIIVLDDLKIYDKKTNRRAGTNDSDIFIKGAVLSDNAIEETKKRKKKKNRFRKKGRNKKRTQKKKASIEIKNATVEYDPHAIASASPHWGIVPGTWRED